MHPAVFILIGCALTGCQQGPTKQELAGVGLLGAAVYALLSWLLLGGVARITRRIRRQSKPIDMTSGVALLLTSHAAITLLIAFFGARPRFDVGMYVLVWICAAANHLTWGLLLWRLVALSPAQAAFIAGVPSLLLGVPGALGSETFSIVVLLQWLWGGFLGAAPLTVVAVIWIDAVLRRSASPDDENRT